MIFGNLDFEIIYKKSFCPDWKKIYQSVAILFYNWQTRKKISEPTEPVEPIQELSMGDPKKLLVI